MEKIYNKRLTYNESKKLCKKINKILRKYDLELFDLIHLNYLCDRLLEELANNDLSDDSLLLLDFLATYKDYFCVDNFL